MFKEFIIIAFCALAIAAPNEATTSILPAAPLSAILPLYKSTLIAQPTHVAVHEPAMVKLGDVVESVPTAVSHQSSTIVHSKAQRIAPIVAPAIRTYTAPSLRSISAPLLRSMSFGPFGLGAAAAFVHANAPIQLRSFPPAALSAPLYRSFGFTYGQPLVYAPTEFKK